MRRPSFTPRKESGRLEGWTHRPLVVAPSVDEVIAFAFGLILVALVCTVLAGIPG